MQYLDEYRDARAVRALARAIADRVTRPWTIMEVCGGQTHAIVKFGLDRLLPSSLELLHGPGCPVCVTPIDCIDHALDMARRPGVMFCSFGDMLRVPGTNADLLSVKAEGADVRMVYSPLDAVELARRHPDREVVFFAVGFETTAPVHAMAVQRARQAGLENFFMLVSQVLVPPALEALMASAETRVQGFLAAGHVCTVMGWRDYEPLAARLRVPMVVTGFEPVDLLQGILMCVEQLEEGRAEVENQYTRTVRPEGNPSARALIRDVFQVVPRVWRGLGEIPASGLALSDAYGAFDAARRFPKLSVSGERPTECRSGLVMRGVLKPPACPAFGSHCTPERPLGPTMVSQEGACAAYYRYRRSPAL